MKSTHLLTLSFLLCLPAATTLAQSPAPTAAVIDFGNNTSETLTVKAWKALENKDYAAVTTYTNRCIDTYKGKAAEMQASLKEPAPKETASQLWALNDVGTCYYIQGQALDAQGDKKGAEAAYKALVESYSFSQCWDPKGWFWSPADAARKRLTELEFDDK